MCDVLFVYCIIDCGTSELSSLTSQYLTDASVGPN